MIKVKRYETLMGCFEACIGHPIPPEEQKIHYWVGHDGSKPFRIRVDKWLKGTSRKSWGWAEYKTRTIHVWFSPECSKDELTITLAHEIGHFQRPRYLIKADEEKKASMYGRVTETALDMAKDLVKESCGG